MSYRELEELAKGERWYEEVAGQLWIERDQILAKIAARGGGPAAAMRELRLLRRRVTREHRLDSKDKMGFFSAWGPRGAWADHVVQKW